MDATTRTRRSRRDWIVDTSMFVLAVLFGLFEVSQRATSPVEPPWLFELDQVVGAAGCAALWLRRRWPVQLGVALVLAIVSGLPPAWRAKQLNIVDALAGR